jgi:hypothetical protein
MVNVSVGAAHLAEDGLVLVRACDALCGRSLVSCAQTEQFPNARGGWWRWRRWWWRRRREANGWWGEILWVGDAQNYIREGPDGGELLVDVAVGVGVKQGFGDWNAGVCCHDGLEVEVGLVVWVWFRSARDCSVGVGCVCVCVWGGGG